MWTAGTPRAGTAAGPDHLSTGGAMVLSELTLGNVERIEPR
jgi:hypothetical protein